MIQEKDISQEILSAITVHMKYAKYIPELKRRETWEEMVYRNKEMHISKFPALQEEISNAYSYVYAKKVLPSMRSMQFAGKPIELSPDRIYNCSFLAVDHIYAFSEIMKLLLGGTGVGFSVQKHHIEKLPEVLKPTKTKRYLVGDSIEGWADAIKTLLKAYFTGSFSPRFDLSDIRPKGARLITSGGKAPGAEPLKDCLHNIRKILDRKEYGDKLEPIEAHDIVCYIADAVLAGGIRRAALISLFSLEDENMMAAKFNHWWELNPQRARANNSVVLARHRLKKKDFIELWKKIEASKCGEPGIFLSNDVEYGTNPCGEVALRSNQFCNLTTINASNIESQEDFEGRVKAATFIGTLQAAYTDFHYLRDSWKKTTEKEALLGVSMTGIASNKLEGIDLSKAVALSVEENKRAAKLMKVKPSARVTTIKPEGTVSCVLGCSSGIHAWHAPYYIRRIRVGKNEAIYTYLMKNNPDLIEDDYFKPHIQAIISIPQKANEGAIIRNNENAIQLMERVKYFYENWILPGHVSGNNTHNVSATISIKDDEWEKVGEWVWKNKECYNGLSFLPYDGGNYTQAPFEEITKEKYEEMYVKLKNIDITEIVEITDETDLKDQVACGGKDSCELV